MLVYWDGSGWEAEGLEVELNGGAVDEQFEVSVVGVGCLNGLFLLDNFEAGD